MQENWDVALSSSKVYHIPWKNLKNAHIEQYKYSNAEIKLPLDSHSHLWLFNLKTFNYKPLFDCLSDDEKQKIYKIIPTRERELRAKSRILLRVVLAKYLITTPETLFFRYNKNGKPILENNIYEVSFNISHSADSLAILIGSKHEIGIDIESETRSCETNLRLSKRFFYAEEHQKLENLKESKQSFFFNRLWTLKEAVLKSTGKGVFLIDETPNFSSIEKDNKISDLIYYQTGDYMGFSLFIDGIWLSTAKRM